jgi:anaerobic ribonucleoside-triphosphate reductase
MQIVFGSNHLPDKRRKEIILSAKLTTTIENIDKKVYNNINRELIRKFYKYLRHRIFQKIIKMVLSKL